MILQSYTLVLNHSYMVFYDTVCPVNGELRPCHYLLYLNGNPRELRSLFLQHKDMFKYPIVYVMDSPSIFKNHSIVVAEDKNKKLYMFNGGI